MGLSLWLGCVDFSCVERLSSYAVFWVFHDSSHIYNDWLSELLVSVVRPHGVDPRPTAQAQDQAWRRQGN